VAKKYREVKQILRAAGRAPRRQAKGSHELWESADGMRAVVISSGGKENDTVPVGTLSNIRRGTGLDELR
jgi:predicted RNA binding protein YcfA (HicA-like mRNA interferase family)